MQLAFLWLMTGRVGKIYKPKGIFSIVRNVLPALRATVYKDFENYLWQMGVYDYVDHRKTRYEFEYDHRTVSFFPTTNEERLKGRQNDFVWINEADGLTFYEYNQLIMRCSGPMWLDYNPSKPECYVKTELEEKRYEKKKDVNIMISIVSDNPFLIDEQREEIETLYDVDRELWEVYAKARWVTFKGLIFPNWEIIPAKDFPQNTLKQCYGLDFGYNDPTALVHMAKEGKTLFIDEKIYQTGMLTADIIKELGVLGIRNDKIIADCYDPKAIKEIRQAGYRCRPCRPGSDSVRKSIDTVKSYTLKITDTSLHFMQELKRYKWKVDKEGNVTNEPIDRYNHAGDAIRYAADYLTRTNTLKIL